MTLATYQTTIRNMALSASKADVKGYLGLRPSDPSYVFPTGEIFHPTRGTPGSIFITQDGQHYTRTRFGNRRLHPMVGQYILSQQRRQRKKTAWTRGLITTVALILSGALALLLI